ncbi:DUF2179 domain-containing protein [Planomicrobium sp. CPCC 101079]|nr:DUF2179 domain-containing protein [Planomicrobium sp. CPCC 101079]TWT03753.1 DUF2179 domain-containing protein [Planomicrobium sp. CPCC 101079]
MGLNPIVLVVIIFMISIVYVTLSTVRMILMMKGYRYFAAALSVLEVIINILGLGLVLENISEIQNLISYAAGFGAGIIVGSVIEDKLTLGYVTATVVSPENSDRLSKQLREKGYGVTDWETNGHEGKRRSLQILTPKKHELKLYQTIKELEPQAFVVANDSKTIHGGFWIRTIRRGRLFNS